MSVRTHTQIQTYMHAWKETRHRAQAIYRQAITQKKLIDQNEEEATARRTHLHAALLVRRTEQAVGVGRPLHVLVVVRCVYID